MSTSSLLTSDLYAVIGQYDGERRSTLGRSVQGDGLGGEFVFALNYFTGDNGVTKINTVNGQWEQDVEGSAISTSLLGLQVVELANTPGLNNGEVKACNGYAEAGDGGGGLFSWSLDASLGADGYLKINATGGQWQRVITDGTLNARWFGARGNRVGTGGSPTPGNANYRGDDDQAAISAAVSAASTLGYDVFLPGGRYRTAGAITLPSSVTFYGAGDKTIVYATADAGFIFLNSKNSILYGLRVEAAAGASGVRLHATDYFINSGYTKDLKVENVFIVMSGNGTGLSSCKGIEFKADTAAAIHFDPTFLNVEIEGTMYDTAVHHTAPGDGATYVKPDLSVGIADISCTGGRWIGGRIWFAGIGFDLRYLDTFEITGCRFGGVLNAGAVAGAGRAIKLRNANLCAIRGTRFEDCDKWIELGAFATATTVDIAQQPTASLIADAGTDTVLRLSGDAITSKCKPAQRFDNRVLIRNLEVICYETTTCVNGDPGSGNNLRLQDDSGFETSFVRIVGPTGPFAISSARLNASGDASAPRTTKLLYVYNTTSQICTIKHEASAAIATERFKCLTGSNIAVQGPAVMKFIYDQTLNGVGDQRFVYIE